MANGCLAVVPCDRQVLCDVCAKSHQTYVDKVMKQRTTESIAWLQHLGYTIQEPEKP